ncbi:hypothetical protein Rrhod_0567 [Rhodococcus rhodnii LMG 5362]|uniref:Uncharacterized protein n=1 Tax=Rhodococcus rhodnii LMG 5362 TaxID=1273125 RepID=R7WRU1_9NOCA|nr:hypothetical protein Rrhod_0567 [Rhodococcus rhodnii LMG 5362]
MIVAIVRIGRIVLGVVCNALQIIEVGVRVVFGWDGT